MTATFTAYFLLCHFYTTTVADNTFITDAFVLSAVTFIILHRTEDTFAEQAVTFRLVGTVVDSPLSPGPGDWE